jgi:GrpB-like predicted nucleotidyltransferase (UPF0157 family)/GNAT superfamily N-acetyltransferase
VSKYTFKPYRIFFPQLFQQEKARIASHVKHILEIEHIGSTAVPNLGGKGIIDIAIACRKEDMDRATIELQELGYEFRPAFSTADRLYFVIELPDPEEEKRRYHVHLTYPENREWKRFIEFRDYLRAHPEAAAEYAEMKKQAAHQANQIGAHYRKTKEPFLEKIDATLNNSSPQVKLISSEKERKEALEFRQKQFFDRIGIQDPYGWTLDQKDHLHWLLYAGEKVIGYAHVQIWPEHRAALRIIVIDQQLRLRGMGKYLMDCCEEMLKKQGVRVLQTEASPSAYLFYQKLGYIEMPFNNPDGEPTHPNDRAMGKFL